MKYSTSLTVAGLFSGIGGIERGLGEAGHDSVFHCEILDPALEVLRQRFPQCRRRRDVSRLKSLPNVDLVTAGFPCQDLSQAGRARGIRGDNSGLVDNVFELIRKKRRKPTWLLLENVPFMLQLNRGRAMRHLTSRIETLGFRWAYRIVDARAFGLPQRRRRVVLLASPDRDPKQVLFADDIGTPPSFDEVAVANGFYWTEGNRGLGWTNNGVPTLKGSSGLGIPSPPAIWLRDANQIVTPDIRDAERLQGFPAGWTQPAQKYSKHRGIRWKLVGNAVSVPMARWIGRRLSAPGTCDKTTDARLNKQATWPAAAWGEDGKAFAASVSEWPCCNKYRALDEFLRYPCDPLSRRATAGFLRRARASSLRFPDGFLDALANHLDRMCDECAVA